MTRGFIGGYAGLASHVIALLAALWVGVAAEAQPYDEQLARSRAAAAEKRFEAAQAAAESAIAIDDARWEGYVLAANAYSSQQLYDDAIGMLQMALPRAPADKKPLIRQAITEARDSATGTSQPPVSATSTTQQEIIVWKAIENSTRVSDYQSYLDQYPNGTYAALARARLVSIQEEQARNPRLENTSWSGRVSYVNRRGVETRSESVEFSLETGGQCSVPTLQECSWKVVGNTLYVSILWKNGTLSRTITGRITAGEAMDATLSYHGIIGAEPPPSTVQLKRY